MARQTKQPQPLTVAPERFRFVRVRQDPVKALLQRLGLAVGLLLLVTLITWLGRDGYVDTEGGDHPLTFIDALYYAAVTVTTTGYGDIVPVTEGARLVSALVVTPLRVLFLVLLIGTTLEVLAERSRFLYRLRHWQKDLHDHVVVCGFGIKGRAALEYIRKHDPECRAVAIDTEAEALEAANAAGISGIQGSAYDLEILRAAGVPAAKTVIVSLESDERSVLTVLRVRELNKKAVLVASCREEANVELLTSSGADQVIVSSSSAGRILGMAAEAPEAARVVNDLLTFGEGLDMNERKIVRPGEPLARDETETPVAVVRDGEVMRPGDERCLPLAADDRVIYISKKTEPAPDEEA